MSGFRQVVLIALAFVVALALASRAEARSEEETIRVSHEVLAEFLNLREQQIPASLLAEAHGVAIIPDVIKLGFVVGGQRGKGVIMIRQPDGTWRGPQFVTVTGGSLGWQAGAQASDFVLVFKTQKGVEGLQRGKFTLGADAAVAAGPVGRRAGAATDSELKAEIYTYSRSRGLFAGVSLEGSALQIDEAANAAYYGPAGAAPPESALRLVQAIAQLSAHPMATVPPPGTSELNLTPAAGTQPTPARDAVALQAELAAAFNKLSPLLDDHWRRYLELPAEVFQPGRAPAPAWISASLLKFDTVARTPQYRTLGDRVEFQTAHRALQAYHAAISGSGAAKLALPPPPGSLSR